MTNTNTITRYAFVKSTAAYNTTTNQKVQVASQIKFEVENGKNKKVQYVTFGYSRLGGRGLYMTVDGGAPKKITKAAFIARIQPINGSKAILSNLRRLHSLHSDAFVVGTCECCKTNHVTAANMDFIQRHSAKLSAQLNRPLTPFSKVCYACQGRAKGTKEMKVAQPTVAYEAKPGVATCAACQKAIQSQRVVDYSLSHFGQALCFGKCQNDAKKASEASLPYSGPATAPSPEGSQDLGGAALAEERPCGDCGIEALLTDAGRCIGCALEHDAAREFPQGDEPQAVDTGDLNAVLDADAVVKDFVGGSAALVFDDAPPVKERATKAKDAAAQAKDAAAFLGEEAEQAPDYEALLKADAAASDLFGSSATPDELPESLQ